MRACLLLTALIVSMLPSRTFALDICDVFFMDPRDFTAEVKKQVLARAPVKYHEMARNIRFVEDVPGALMPLATEQQGVKIVAVPTPFARMVCQITIAYGLHAKDTEGLNRLSRTAAKCLDKWQEPPKCLIAFGNDLARHYKLNFGLSDQDHQRFWYSYVTEALLLLIQHEYAHHFLDHFSRIRNKTLTRADAEFEADLFVLTNGSTEPPAVMSYLFAGLTNVERFTEKLTTPNYESASCRGFNVTAVGVLVGAVPLGVLDTVAGGGTWFSKNSPGKFRWLVTDHFGRGLPELAEPGCDRLAKAQVVATFNELKELAWRVSSDADFLFTSSREPPDAARTASLIRDLRAMAERFEHADAIASKSIALLFARWSANFVEHADLSDELDRLMANRQVTDGLQGRDYAQLLSAQGRVILEKRWEIPLDTRLMQGSDLMERALKFDAADAMALAGLGFARFKYGDCAQAARHFQDLEQAPHEDLVRMAKEQVQKMQRLTDPVACKAAAAKFHPFPGW